MKVYNVTLGFYTHDELRGQVAIDEKNIHSLIYEVLNFPLRYPGVSIVLCEDEIRIRRDNGYIDIQNISFDEEIEVVGDTINALTNRLPWYWAQRVVFFTDEKGEWKFLLVRRAIHPCTDENTTVIGGVYAPPRVKLPTGPEIYSDQLAQVKQILRGVDLRSIQGWKESLIAFSRLPIDLVIQLTNLFKTEDGIKKLFGKQSFKKCLKTIDGEVVSKLLIATNFDGGY